MENRLFGQVDKIYPNSGRGVILGNRGGAKYIMQFFTIEAPGLKPGDWVSFIPGLYKAIDIKKEAAKMDNVIAVNFKERRRYE